MPFTSLKTGSMHLSSAPKLHRLWNTACTEWLYQWETRTVRLHNYAGRMEHVTVLHLACTTMLSCLSKHKQWCTNLLIMQNRHPYDRYSILDFSIFGYRAVERSWQTAKKPIYQQLFLLSYWIYYLNSLLIPVFFIAMIIWSNGSWIVRTRPLI